MTASGRSLEPIDGYEGLTGPTGLDEAEALMVRLAVGSRLDRVGAITREHLESGGKRMRARLALAAAEVLGVDRKAAAPWAAACELLHAATLVHDDIQDGDEMRRGHRSAWARHGVAQAINAGDLLIVLPLQAIGMLPVADEVRWKLTCVMARRAAETVRGQAQELDLLPSGRHTWQDWASAARGKAGELLAMPVEGAALLAGLSEVTARRLSEPFATLGVLYQACDDCLDLYGDKGREAPGNDLREGKVSLLVTEHVRLHGEDRDALLRTLRAPRSETSQDEVDDWMRRFREGETLRACQDRIRSLADQVQSDPHLRSIPALHEVACTLMSMVQR